MLEVNIIFQIYVSFDKLILGPYTNPDLTTKLRKLIEMGVHDHEARVALSSYDWDLERATEQLFS